MGNAAPLFSVVIPVFNRAHLISRAIFSVLDQRFGNFEIIVVDDGSSDDPAAVVASIRDSRIRFVRRENGGGGAARNTGIDVARGRYIAFLDSDDLFLPQKLSRFAEQMPDDERVVGYSLMNVDRGVGRYWIRPSREIKPDESVGEYLFVSNEFIQTSTIVVRREFAAEVRFDPSLKKGQDLDFCVRLEKEGARFLMINEPLTIWCDLGEVGRTSRVLGHEAPELWLSRSRHLLTRRAQLGYRATVLSYYLAKKRPLTVAVDFVVGWVIAGVPARVIFRQAMRAYLPRGTYRTLVGIIVKYFAGYNNSRRVSARSPDGSKE